MQKIRLRIEGPIVMHWGVGYPSREDVWLAYFENDSNLYVCRVEGTDELGGNLVDLTLQRARAAEPQRFRDVVNFSFRGEPYTVPIVSWEPLNFRLTEEQWFRFLNREIYPSDWQSIDNRMRLPQQDGKGGYTRETIEYSLSREYEGP